MCRVTLLGVNALVVLQDLVDPRHVGAELLRRRPLPPPIAGRDRKLQHLRNGVAMNAKPLRCLPAAQPVHHHRTSYPSIEFHCEHPSSPSMPLNGIKAA